MSKSLRTIFLHIALSSALLLAAGTLPVYTHPQGVVLTGLPDKIDPKAEYLFYLHGKIIEEKGIRPTDPKYGIYEYEQILDAMKAHGFVVISEARSKGTESKEYSKKVVHQINALLKAGVLPSKITVVGASKGSVIAMLASTLLKQSNVNFVLMSNCNDWVLDNFDIRLHGNVLSIYDVNDEFGRSCRKFFDRAARPGRHKEVELKIGTGHAILYKPMKEWIDLIVEWARQS